MIKTILQIILGSALVLASPEPSNNFKLGDGTASNKSITFNRGASNPSIKWNESTSSLQFSNDSTNFSDLGSGSGSGSGGFNVLTNPDFETGIALGWTNTGGTFAAVSGGANLLFGKGSATYIAGSGNHLDSSLYVIPNGLQGQNCAVGMWYKGGDSNLTLEAIDGSSNVLASRVLSATTVAVPFFATFPCPASGSFQLRLLGTGSAALVALDRMFLGENQLIPISQASFVGSAKWPASASCTWAATQTSFASFSANSNCTFPSGSGLKGSASAPASKIPAITFGTLPPGKYLIMASGAFQNGASNRSDFTFFDGTGYGSNHQNSISVTGTVAVPLILNEFEYTTAQSNITFEIQCASNASTCTIDDAQNTPNDDLTITVYRYPTVQETAFKPDAVANSWSGYHNGDCDWAFTSTSLADPSADTSCTFTTANSVNFGTVTSYNDGTPGNNLPGIVFTPSRPGTYYVCANFAIQGGGNVAIDTELSDLTPTRIAYLTFQTSGTNQSPGAPLCGTYTTTGVSSKTIRIRAKTNTSTSDIASVTTNAHAIDWSIFQIDQSLPSPLLVNSVVSPSAGVERITRATIADGSACSSDPCTITRQSGSWLTVVNRSSTGTYVAHLSAGTFSDVPSCTCTAQASARRCALDATDSVTLDIAIDENGGTAFDNAFQIICVGPR